MNVGWNDGWTIGQVGGWLSEWMDLWEDRFTGRRIARRMLDGCLLLFQDDFLNLFINLLFTTSGLLCCVWASSSCGKQGLPFAVVRGLLIVLASPVAEAPERGLSGCRAQASLPRGTWSLSRPGIEPMSPALAARFSYTGLAGTSSSKMIYQAKLADNKFSLTQIPIWFASSLYNTYINIQRFFLFW